MAPNAPSNSASPERAELPTLPPVDALIDALAAQIAPRIDRASCALVGIHSGGVWVAEHLHRRLGLTLPLGTIDVGLHRDDLERTGLRTSMRASMIPFEVTGADIVLVDDVLYTGRTIRAAMNELFDYGRPDRIRLAALVDRDGRHLPIAASFTGATVALDDSHEIVLDRIDSQGSTGAAGPAADAGAAPGTAQIANPGDGISASALVLRIEPRSGPRTQE